MYWTANSSSISKANLHCVASDPAVFGARGWRHAFRKIGNQPARNLILAAPSCGLDQMFAELGAATAAGNPKIGELMAITAKYGVAIESPAT
jgi:hypothetical protein